MVHIKVNDSGECRVTVRGPWETVKKNLEVAANKVREMGHDSKQFASITDGTYIPPMKPPKQYREDPSQEQYPAQSRELRPARQPMNNSLPHTVYPARQPHVSRPPQDERPAGGAA